MSLLPYGSFGCLSHQMWFAELFRHKMLRRKCQMLAATLFPSQLLSAESRSRPAVRNQEGQAQTPTGVVLAPQRILLAHRCWTNRATSLAKDQRYACEPTGVASGDGASASVSPTYLVSKGAAVTPKITVSTSAPS